MPAYHRPDLLETALNVLASEQVRIAAGCTDLFPATQARMLDQPVLDITGIDGLRGISCDGSGLRIGAATTWTDVIRADLPPAFDMLKQAAREVGSIQIQNAGTIAGNLCNASPAADGVPCLLALDAEVEIAAQGSTRQVRLDQFIKAPRQVDLQANEMVVALHIPASALTGRSGFLKLGARRYLVISIAMVAARIEVEAGRITHAAVAVGACSGVAQRLSALEKALTDVDVVHAADHVTSELVTDALSPIDDIRADAGYRNHAAAELVQQVISQLTKPAEVTA